MSITLDRNLAISTLDRAPNQDAEFAGRMLERIFAAAQPGAVFGAPVTCGAYTVITASEVGAGGGFGAGRGTIPRPAGQAPETTAAGESGGSGGGGGAGGRPIAAIIIGPDGVTIRPILDLTKIALAGITAWGALLVPLLRLRAKRR